MTSGAPSKKANAGIEISGRQLLIAGKPFLVLGGELHNSSASTKAALDARWAGLLDLGMNTVLAPITWEQVEPREGEFDFTSVDDLLAGARANGLRVIPLWFGSWKNGLSSYRPAWVKRDPDRFPLVIGNDGKRLQVLSAFSAENRDADARAFGAVMRHIAKVDATKKTVIMVQVENEVGILGASRDHTAAASGVYQAPVDPGLIAFLAKNAAELKPSIVRALATGGRSTNWPDTFGESLDTDELFQALGYARYVDAVIAAGRAEYDIPYFVNAWLDSPAYSAENAYMGPAGGQVPGTYPSGGPLPQVFGAWLYGAPNASMLTPDIYFGDFTDWCTRFSTSDVGFFIPEMKKDVAGVAGIHVAIGSFGAIGTSPFGIDGADDEYARADKELLGTSYRAIAGMSDVILAAQSRGEIIGFELTNDHRQQVTDFGGYQLTISRDRDDGTIESLPTAWGIVASDGEGGYVGTGAGFCVTFDSHTPERTVALESVESGSWVNGQWVTTQILNGDETISGERWRFPYLAVIPGISFGEPFAHARVLRARVYEY